MRIEDYPRYLKILANTNSTSKFLEADSKGLLINSATSLGLSVNRRGENWKFTIPRERPLTFKKNDSNLQIDISCEIEGKGNEVTKQNILLRIWSFDKNVCYREGIDHPKTMHKFEESGLKRVILCFHFDLRALGVKQPEPLYHLQVGGTNPNDDGNCWFPEHIDVPRFPYPPMDIILMCEFVLMNFFHKDYKRIREDPTWKSLVRKSQVFFQKHYFDRCVGYLNDRNGTLMGNLSAYDSEL